MMTKQTFAALKRSLMWDEWGVLNFHVQPWSWKHSLISGSQMLIFSSLQAPVKCVSWSDRRCFTGPLIDKKRCKAGSRHCLQMHCFGVQVSKHHSPSFTFGTVWPLSRWAVTFPGPNTSGQTCLKGGSKVTAGKLAVFLHLHPFSQLPAGNTLMDHAGNEYLGSNNPQSCCA